MFTVLQGVPINIGIKGRLENRLRFPMLRNDKGCVKKKSVPSNLMEIQGVPQKALNISFKKVVLPGRVKCGGTEGEIVVVHGCRKTKKLICGTGGEIVVAHGRLPYPSRNSIVL